jgi:hypothetical protein
LLLRFKLYVMNVNTNTHIILQRLQHYTLYQIGCWLLAAGCWLLAAGCWLLAACCWLLAAGCYAPIYGTAQGHQNGWCTLGCVCSPAGSPHKGVYASQWGLPTGEPHHQGPNGLLAMRLHSNSLLAAMHHTTGFAARCNAQYCTICRFAIPIYPHHQCPNGLLAMRLKSNSLLVWMCLYIYCTQVAPLQVCPDICSLTRGRCAAALIIFYVAPTTFSACHCLMFCSFFCSITT